MREKKRVLFTSNTANFHKFNRPLMRMLRGALEDPYTDLNIGNWEVDYASANEEQVFDADNVYKIDFSRNPFALHKHIRAYKQLKTLLKKNHYDLIHTHTPVGSIICRLAAKEARKNGTKVIYTAHGFHFFKGASLASWMLWYPLEKHFAKSCDRIITINKEDYLRAKKHFKVKVSQIHGVGVDTELFGQKITKAKAAELRKTIGLKPDDFAIVYAAEYSKNKNHKFLLESLAPLLKEHSNIKILLLGKGARQADAEKLAKELGVSDQVLFLGYRNDMHDVFQCCDLDVSCSIREGLGLGVLEAQLCGLPVILSDNRGHREIVQKHTQNLYPLNKPEVFRKKVLQAYKKEKDFYLPFREVFSLRSSLSTMRKIYLEETK